MVGANSMGAGSSDQEVTAGSRFTTFLATVLTLSGVAIGLGNVWRFPYMMGAFGGSTFLVLAVPAMSAELALSRSYRGATIMVLRRAFGPFGRAAGYVIVIGVIAAAAYYILIVANVFYSAWFSVVHGYRADNIPVYTHNLSRLGLQFILALLIAWSALWVIHRGLTDGIERVSKLFVPLFFVTALYLIYAALSQPGTIEKMKMFLHPDFSRIGPREVFAALGQCIFSTGLGASYIMVYGEFMRDDSSLQSC